MICLLGKNQVTNMTSDKGADLTNYPFDPRKNGVIPFLPLRLNRVPTESDRSVMLYWRNFNLSLIGFCTNLG